MSNKLLKEHRFSLSPSELSSEGLSIVTKFYANGDEITPTGGVFVNQTITLQSYCNSASFNLIGTTLNSKILRMLADELDFHRASIANEKQN